MAFLEETLLLASLLAILVSTLVGMGLIYALFMFTNHPLIILPLMFLYFLFQIFLIMKVRGKAIENWG